MIELFKGDNLEIIPTLSNRPNIIYLDPPYNTKNSDLSFGDSFSNGEWSEHFRDRVDAIKKIIAKNAVIYVSIGHEELANAKTILDEIFGKNGFVAIMPRITSKTSKTSKTISRINDFVIIHKVGNVEFIQDNVRPDPYKLIDEHVEVRGKYFLRRLDYKDFSYQASMDYKIENNGVEYFASGSKKSFEERKKTALNKDWCWIWSKNRFDFALKSGFIVFKNGRVFKKTYESAKIINIKNGYDIEIGKRGQPFSTLELMDYKYANKASEKNSLERLFSYPKSYELLEFLFMLPNFSEKRILDAYSGSGASGVVATKLGFNCTLIQKDEKVNENSAIFKKGYGDIFDLTVAILKEKKIKVNIKKNEVNINE